MVEVKITNISITQVGFAILLKSADDERVVPIFIGPLETHSISSVLSGNVPPRPMTHDLMIELLTSLGAKILRVVIRELKDNTFYANIHIKTEEGIIDIDARPSDSIALALRQDVPIFMADEVLEEAGIILPDLDEETQEDSEIEMGTILESSDKAHSELSGKSKPLSPQNPQNPKEKKIDNLKKQLMLAVELENYEEAAKIRDQIQNLTQEN